VGVKARKETRCGKREKKHWIHVGRKGKKLREGGHVYSLWTFPWGVERNKREEKKFGQMVKLRKVNF